MKKLFLFLVLGMFMISFASAGLLDFNKKSFDESQGEYGKVIIDDWFGLGKQAELQLTENTELCKKGICEAKIPEFILYEDDVLIEDIRFIGSQPKEYAIYVNDKIYNVGEEVEAGTYEVRIVGELKIFHSTDWQIKVAGYWIEEYALWTAEDGLQSYYALDGTAGVVVDSLGSNDGTNTGADRGTAGVINNSFDFESSESDYVDIPQKDYSDFTVNLWMNPETSFGANWGHIVADQDGNDRIMIKSGTTLTMQVDGAEVDTSGITSHAGVFRMYTLTRAGTQFMVYVNGTQIGTNTTVSANTFTIDSFARKQGASSIDFFDGKMDEIGFWNRSLTEEEITELYNSGQGTSFGTNPIITTLNSPADNKVISTLNTIFNASSSVSSGVEIINMSLWTNQSGTFQAENSTTGLSGQTNNTLWDHNLGSEGSFLWNVQSCGDNNNCSFAASNRTIKVDSSAPIITINAPTTTINYGRTGLNETLNWSITDSNLDSIWYNYNETNVTVFGATNTTNFTIGTFDDRTIVVYANDSVGNENSSTISWVYNLWQKSETFNTNTSEGSTEDFILNVSLKSGLQVSQANLIYNNTAYSGIINNVAGSNYSLSRSLQIPGVVVTTSNTLYWSITLSDSSQINTTSNLQGVIGISIDDCSVNANRLYNFTVVDEITQLQFSESAFNTSGKINLQMYTLDGTTLVENLTLNKPGEDSYLVCLSTDLSGGVQYSLDAQIQYDADEYAKEFYHIQNATIQQDSLYTNITLYDLIDAESQEFVVTYKDSSFLPVADALVQVQRKYIDEGVFKTVELPKTDTSGETLAHLELADAIYTFVVVKNGEILGTFSNVLAVCQDIILGNCDINLNSLASGTTVEDFTTLDDLTISLTYNQTSRILESVFVVPSGTTKALKMNATLFDSLGSTQICNDALISSSGTLSCTAPSTFGNGTMVVTIASDSENVIEAVVSLAQINRDIYGNSIVFLLVFLYLTLFGVGISSDPMVTGVFIIIGALTAIGLNIVNAPFVIGAGATFLWLGIVIVLILIKGARRV